jgi:hypothetical protein
MTHYRLRTLVFRVMQGADIASFFLIGVVLATVRWDPKQLPVSGALSPIMKWVQAESPALLIGLFVVSYLCRLRTYLKPPETWKKINALLNELQKMLFKEERDRGEPLHNHRVTLFKQGWCIRRGVWPLNGWLVPVERSGHMTRKTKTIFRAPDDPNRLEGVAGLTWCTRGVVAIGDLPDLNGSVASNLQEAAIEEYASKTLVKPEWVRKRIKERKTLGRSFCGIPVEVNGGTLWGVIVVDSQTPLPKAGSQYEDAYRLIASVLGKLLEGG